MADESGEFTDAVGSVRVAVAVMAAGSGELYTDCWAMSVDTTLFDAWSPSNGDTSGCPGPSVGWSADSGTGASPRTIPSPPSPAMIAATPWVSSVARWSSITGQPHPMNITGTHVYRHIDGQWRVMQHDAVGK
jgi:hypothetical protein